MNNSTNYNLGLLGLRIGFSAMLLTHGILKLLQLLSGNFAFADPIGIGEPTSLILAIIGEVFGPVLVIIGLKTRWATIPTIVTMLVAILVVHGNDAIDIKEKAILYLIGFAVIAILGPGKYSIDRN